MKFLYNWIKKLLNTKELVRKGPEDDQLGYSFENVVVGKILEIEKHPNADRLQVAKTDVGGEVLQIVCGASNIAVGQKIPVALVGAKLPASPAGGPNGMEIKEVEIRGVKSFGMLCAEDELGLSKDHSGIMILDEKAEVGSEFASYTNKQ